MIEINSNRHTKKNKTLENQHEPNKTKESNIEKQSESQKTKNMKSNEIQQSEVASPKITM